MNNNLIISILILLFLTGCSIHTTRYIFKGSYNPKTMELVKKPYKKVCYFMKFYEENSEYVSFFSIPVMSLSGNDYYGFVCRWHDKNTKIKRKLIYPIENYEIGDGVENLEFKLSENEDYKPLECKPNRKYEKRYGFISCVTKGIEVGDKIYYRYKFNGVLHDYFMIKTHEQNNFGLLLPPAFNGVAAPIKNYKGKDEIIKKHLEEIATNKQTQKTNL